VSLLFILLHIVLECTRAKGSEKNYFHGSFGYFLVITSKTFLKNFDYIQCNTGFYYMFVFVVSIVYMNYIQDLGEHLIIRIRFLVSRVWEYVETQYDDDDECNSERRNKTVEKKDWHGIQGTFYFFAGRQDIIRTTDVHKFVRVRKFVRRVEASLSVWREVIAKMNKTDSIISVSHLFIWNRKQRSHCWYAEGLKIVKTFFFPLVGAITSGSHYFWMDIQKRETWRGVQSKAFIYFSVAWVIIYFT